MANSTTIDSLTYTYLRSDMFSVGAILVECLTKKVLFENHLEDSQASQIFSIINRLGYPPQSFIEHPLTVATIAFISHTVGTPATPIRDLIPEGENTTEFIGLIESLLCFGMCVNGIYVVDNMKLAWV